MKNLNLVLATMLAASTLSTVAYSRESSAELQELSGQALASAIANPTRAEDASRDQFRHPAETIRFFGIEPGMTVVDYFPAPGWYTRILVPYLGEQGTYIGAVREVPGSSAESRYRQRVFPERFPQLMRAEIKGGAEIKAIDTAYIPDELYGTADRVVIFRMLHNMYRRNLIFEELGKLRKLLKDGGMLGIVQHRARADAPYSYADGNNGYMRQEDVIKLVEAHGFELVATSEINANPSDPANHEGGVWQLPPDWSSKDEALKKIGESDRMTLLFKKRM